MFPVATADCSFQTFSGSKSFLGLTLGSCAPTPVVLVFTEEPMMWPLTKADIGQAELEDQNLEDLGRYFATLVSIEGGFLKKV